MNSIVTSSQLGVQCATDLHTAAAPAVRAAVKTELSYRQDNSLFFQGKISADQYHVTLSRDLIACFFFKVDR